MDTCVICGKSREGIILELAEDDGQIREKYICKSCWEVIASIAVKVVVSELKPLTDELEPIIEFVKTFKELDNQNNKLKEHIADIEKTTSEIDEFLAKNEELFGDENPSDEELDIDEYSNDEKVIIGALKDALVDELLSFAKDMDIDEDEADSLGREVVELFWKSKGIRNEFSASAEIRIRMKQVEKMAHAKMVANIFSVSNDELARELADYAKKKEGKENGQGVYVQSAAFTFWRNKGLDYRAEALEIEQRKGQIERLAQEIVDKDFHDWRDKRLQTENQYLPQLVQACVDWARNTGRNSVTIKDVKYFRQEKKIELLEATERALYVSTNNELKAKKQSSS
jgi:hypothetical protein